MKFYQARNQQGFTLIELLVVIAIIGILSSVVLASLNTARERAGDAYRKASLKELQLALELYRDTHGSYPSTGGSAWGLSSHTGSRTTSGPNAYIPGLTPTYMSSLPADPSGDTSGWSGFVYISDGTNYKLLVHHNGPASFPNAGEPFYDPVRPTWSWMICSGEPACSSW